MNLKPALNRPIRRAVAALAMLGLIALAISTGAAARLAGRETPSHNPVQAAPPEHAAAHEHSGAFARQDVGRSVVDADELPASASPVRQAVRAVIVTLFVVGIVDLAWMALYILFIFIEKAITGVRRSIAGIDKVKEVHT